MRRVAANVKGNNLNSKLAAKKPRKKKEAEAEVEDVAQEIEVEQEENAEKFLASIMSLQEEAEDKSFKPRRLLHLFGEIEEEKCAEIACALRILGSMAKDDPEDKKEPIEMIISTQGGSAAEMFAVYDTMRLVRDDGCDIVTTGLGKVMSAGVLLLAAGTEGRRRIGANCRVMLHGVASGHVGQISSLENELEEVRWTQEQYIKALAKETDMTVKYIKKLIDRGVNVYLTAKQAVELGVADEIF